MGLGHSPSIVTSGLVLALDAGNTKSYPNTGTIWTDLSGQGNTGTLTNGPTFNSYEARTNGNLYSNAVTNAYYTASFVTTGSSSETAPDGTTTASYFTLSATATTYKGVTGGYISYPTSSIVTISCFVKPTGGARYFWIREGGYGASRVGFDLTSVSVFSSSSATGYINAAGNGWYRVQAVMGALPQSSARVQLLGASDTTPPGNSNVSSTGTETYHIWGAQCELGAFATSPMLTTSSPVTRSAGPATLVFDGLDDYATVSNNISPGTGDFAVSVFVYKTDTVTNRYVWDFGSNGGTLASGTSITTEFRYYNPTVGYILGPTQTVNTWYNLVISRISGITYFYSNGSLVNSAADTGNIGSWGTTLNIGRYGGGGYIHLGSISNLFVYKGIGLTAAQVLQNFNALRGRFGL